MAAVVGAWWFSPPTGLSAGIASGNGRVEATEIDLAAEVPGSIVEVLAREGDFVQGYGRGAHRYQVLRPQQAEARTQVRQAASVHVTAEAIVV